MAWAYVVELNTEMAFDILVLIDADFKSLRNACGKIYDFLYISDCIGYSVRIVHLRMNMNLDFWESGPGRTTIGKGRHKGGLFAV